MPFFMFKALSSETSSVRPGLEGVISASWRLMTWRCVAATLSPGGTYVLVGFAIGIRLSEKFWNAALAWAADCRLGVVSEAIERGAPDVDGEALVGDISNSSCVRVSLAGQLQFQIASTPGTMSWADHVAIMRTAQPAGRRWTFHNATTGPEGVSDKMFWIGLGRRMGQTPYPLRLRHGSRELRSTPQGLCRCDVSVTLRSADLKRVQVALRVLLSSLDCESVTTWRAHSLRAVGALLPADLAVSVLPLAGEPPYHSEHLPAPHRCIERRLTLGLTTHHHSVGSGPPVSTLRGRRERPHQAAWSRAGHHGGIVARQSCQPCGLTVVRSPADLTCGPMGNFSGIAGLWFYNDKEDPLRAGKRELAILKILQPAFEAGVDFLVRRYQLLSETLAAIPVGVALYNDRGRKTEQNRLLASLLAGDPEVALLEAACEHVARSLLELAAGGAAKSRSACLWPPVSRQVHTSSGTYRIRGGLAGQYLGVGRPLALVTVENLIRSAQSIRRLRDAFHLTEREGVVARLLAVGHANPQIASILGISVHTVRRHVEQVLAKLGVHTRASVGTTVRSGELEMGG